MSRILLLEPDTLLATIYTQAFTRAGFIVDCVPSAQVAIDAADAHAPDVVITEMHMPAHDGVEFLYEFRSYAEWQQVPVIIHSYASPEQLATVRSTLEAELGVIAILYKPQTSLHKLLACVREQMGAAA